MTDTAGLNGQQTSSDAPTLTEDLRAEQAVLGTMLLRPDKIPDVVGGKPPLRADDYSRPFHRLIHQAIVDMHAAGTLVDPISVTHRLIATGGWVQDAEHTYLHTLTANVPTVENGGYYARIVTELARRRRTKERYERGARLVLTTSTEGFKELTAHDGAAFLATSDEVSTATDPDQTRLDALIDLDRLATSDTVFNIPDGVPAVWGTRDEVLWAKDEAVIITGPPGVGKTTLIQQVVLRMLGIGDPSLLGYEITPTRGKILYLAMDRPRQVLRSLRRMVRHDHAPLLRERLVIWQGPPPADLAAEPKLLLHLARKAGADVVIVDSLKDAFVGLTDDKLAASWNRGLQLALAHGVQVGILHHQKKHGDGGAGKPKSLADVYGSAWITAGVGSVILLWGEPGDAAVELSHLKQPADKIGPVTVLHDHVMGTSTVADESVPVDVLNYVQAAYPHAVTTRGLAYRLHPDVPKIERKHLMQAQRKLDGLVQRGLATRSEHSGLAEGHLYTAVMGTDPSVSHNYNLKTTVTGRDVTPLHADVTPTPKGAGQLVTPPHVSVTVQAVPPPRHGLPLLEGETVTGRDGPRDGP